MAGTIRMGNLRTGRGHEVSMESGLDGRNNLTEHVGVHDQPIVSMESGLDGRNNVCRIR